MSQENVEIVNRAIDAFNERNVGAFADLLTPDFAWLPATVEGDTYRGREGIERYFAEMLDSWEEVRVVAEEYRFSVTECLFWDALRAVVKAAEYP